MKKLFVVLLILFPVLVDAQISYTVSGVLTDEESGEPLVYASVRVKGRKISTISNNQGKFDFHVPQSNLQDTLVISMLGYANYTAIISGIVNQPDLTIEMKREVIILEEVVIADSLTPGDIVRIALNKIELNYPMEPYGMHGFYRDVKSVDGEYVSLLEAAVTIFDKGYKDPRNPTRLKERVGLQEVRKSMGYDKVALRWFDQTNLLEDLLLHNNVKYRTFPEEDLFFQALSLNGYTSYNGHLVYVIELDADYYLQLFIDANDYSIIRIQFEIGDGEVPVRVEKKNRRKSNFIMNIKRVLDFQRYGQRVYLHYINVETDTRWVNTKNNRELATTRLFQELLINNILTEDYSIISSAQKMKSFGLQYQDMPYNKEFWDTYNVIKDSPLEAAIIRDLERRTPLEKQFEKN